MGFDELKASAILVQPNPFADKVNARIRDTLLIIQYFS